MMLRRGSWLLVVTTLMMLCTTVILQADTGKPGRAEGSSDSAVVKSPKGAMLRSLAVPGWGQFYNGQWFKGVLLAGAEIGLAANAVVLNQWVQQTTDETERFYYEDSRNLSYWLLAGAILFSMVDAFVDAHLYEFDESPDLAIRVISERERFIPVTNMSWRLSWSFPLQ